MKNDDDKKEDTFDYEKYFNDLLKEPNDDPKQKDGFWTKTTWEEHKKTKKEGE